MTLTIGGSSIVIQARGTTSGNDRDGYGIFMQLTANAGQVPGFPNCSVRGNSSGSGDRFPSPFKTISTQPFNIQYTGCNGFIDPPPQRTDVVESSQLSLSKP